MHDVRVDIGLAELRAARALIAWLIGYIAATRSTRLPWEYAGRGRCLSGGWRGRRSPISVAVDARALLREVSDACRALRTLSVEASVVVESGIDNGATRPGAASGFSMRLRIACGPRPRPQVKADATARILSDISRREGWIEIPLDRRIRDLPAVEMHTYRRVSGDSRLAGPDSTISPW